MKPYAFGFIGAGKLAGSVIRGLLLKKFCGSATIVASEPNTETRTQLQNELGISFTTANTEVAEKAEIVFLGVKPQMVLPVLRELGGALTNKLVVSFAAGIRIAQMEAVTPARIMRVLTKRRAQSDAPRVRLPLDHARRIRIGKKFGRCSAQSDSRCKWMTIKWTP